MSFTVKKINESDLIEISKICDDSISDPFGIQGFKDLYKLEHVKILKSVNQDEITGYIVLSIVKDEAEILSIAVGENFRRQGFAKLLMKEGLNLIKKSDAKKVFLEVREDNICAINLYRSFGFNIIAVRKNYYKDKKTALVMMAEL